MPLVVTVVVSASLKVIELPVPLVVACNALALLKDAVAPALLKKAGGTAVEECHSSVVVASKPVRRYPSSSSSTSSTTYTHSMSYTSST